MTIHKPVLLKEAIELLNLKEDSIVVDATLGGGGHSREILKKIGDGGKLIAFDLDIRAIENFAEFPISNFQFSNNFQIPIFKFKNTVLVNDNFSNLDKVLEALKIEKVDAVLADLGWSSDQLEGKGMSFMREEILDMRLNQKQELSAEEIVNGYSEKELERIIREYGEERWAKRITQKIGEARKIKEIRTTSELGEIIERAIPRKFWPKGINPATRTFQAIRIEVNQELKNLENFIAQATSVLAPKGRLAIISFHSLEDRIVKNIYRVNARGRVHIDELTGQEIVEVAPEVIIITKKPVVPSEDELENNPRARSAKLRVLEKI
jgi:16S rRNA (cytosine1402-N4)-methyltransferase